MSMFVICAAKNSLHKLRCRTVESRTFEKGYSMRRCLASAAAVFCLALPAMADRTYRMAFEDRQITIIRVDREPTRTAASAQAGGPPPSKALRVGDAADSAQALRALEAFCAMAPGELKDFGAHGDPLWHDRASGHWVVWFDCAPKLSR